MKTLLYLLPFVLLLVLASVSKAKTPEARATTEHQTEHRPFSTVTLSLGTGLRGSEFAASLAISTPLWKNGELELGYTSAGYGDSQSLLCRHTFSWKVLRFGLHAGAQRGTYVFSRINDPAWFSSSETVVSGFDDVLIGRVGLHAGLDLPGGFGMRVVLGRGLLLSGTEPVEFSGSGKEPASMTRMPLFGGTEIYYEF